MANILKKIPNFFIVGKAKSGTTALHNMLDQHPDIFMSREKEPHHFHLDYIEDVERRHGNKLDLPYKSLEDYLRLFEGAAGQKIIGETSTGYIFSEQAAQAIADFNSNAKILVIFREPIEFVRSFHSQELRSANEDEPDFRKAWLLEDSRKQGENVPWSSFYVRNLLYSEQAKYCEQIERYLRVFDRRQVKIVIYEDFLKDNISVYEEILKFLDVDPAFKPKIVNLNRAKRTRFPRIAAWLVYHGQRKKGAIKQWAPTWLFELIGIMLSRVFYPKGSREQLDLEFRGQLLAKFGPEVLRLGDILGVDLVKKWGYENIRERNTILPNK